MGRLRFLNQKLGKRPSRRAGRDAVLRQELARRRVARRRVTAAPSTLTAPAGPARQSGRTR